MNLLLCIMGVFDMGSDDIILNKEKPIYYGNSAPMKFIEDIDEKKHIVHFYEDQEYAKMIHFKFIQNGLEKQEICIYAMDDEPEIIEKEMSDFGIDVEKFKKEKLLRISKIPSSYDYSSNALESAKKFWSTVMSDSDSPVRLVSTFTHEINKSDAIEAQISVECHLHSTFDDFPGSWICPYHVQNIESKNRGKWMIDLIHAHQTAVFSSKSENGMVLNMQ